MKKVVKEEIKITKSQSKGVIKVLKSKVKVGKITKTQYKIAVKKVKTRTLITKAEFKAEVGQLKIKMSTGDITPIVYKKTVKSRMQNVRNGPSSRSRCRVVGMAMEKAVAYTAWRYTCSCSASGTTLGRNMLGNTTRTETCESNTSPHGIGSVVTARRDNTGSV